MNGRGGLRTLDSFVAPKAPLYTASAVCQGVTCPPMINLLIGTLFAQTHRLTPEKMDRETLIGRLKEDLARGQVVTITGTGVSVAACHNQIIEGFKVATWTGLLEHGVKHCRDIGLADDADAELLKMQIKSGKIDFLIAAAETVSQRM